MSRYALMGPTTRDLLTYRGRVLVHDNREELEWLLPNAIVVRVSDGNLGAPVLPLKNHPGLDHLTWPLNRTEFR